ncbi:MAG: acyl-CoA dehydrogenase [Parvibaculum sp.]|jgi:alkylation response protein AidB-like acyl-CoA dehydrogenase|nr:acyl-CoA dehydrogenase [Parvibaculum sp.]|tara:strand:+ start:6588 stop:7730 length:1143 start_codon:yes stop_codon:yes gene_type:complete
MNAEEYLETATRFRREVVEPNAAQWETAQRQPVAALKQAADAGLMRLETPVEAGGYGLSFLTKLALCEDMSRADMPFTFALINTQNVAARLSATANPRHLTDYVPRILAGDLFAATALSEPGAGSDFAGITTRATKVDGGWELTGEKGWITNAEIANLFVTYAQCKPLGDPDAGWRGVGSFLVDATRAGFRRVEPYALAGGHAIGAGGFKLDRYFVADEDVLGGPGDGFKSAMSGVNGARVYVAAMCAGLVADALEKAVSYGATRKAFGETLLSHQGLKWSLAEVATELEAMRALTHWAGVLIEGGGDAVTRAAQAKKFATERAVTLIEGCIQAMGANGLREEHGLGRHLISAKIAGFTDGSIEMMNERIGAALQKEYAS